MKSVPSSQDSRWDDEVIKILRQVGSLRVEYPPELFIARRAAFIFDVQRQEQKEDDDRLSSTDRFIQHFESLKFTRAEYPSELLAARRAAFIELVGQHSKADVPEELPQDLEFVQLLKNLKPVEAEYPSKLMVARRVAFKRQIAAVGRVSVLEALRISLRNLFLHKPKILSLPTMNMMRTALVVAVLMLAVVVGSLLENREQAASPSPQAQVAGPGAIFTTTGTEGTAPVVCKPGYLPPLCLMKEFDKSQDLTFPGNGEARPAVAKDTLPGYSGVHKPAYVNDGLYGPGASWISNSPYSWIKIDLGKSTTINTVAFGRDRLGNFNDRDPGQFIIAVALSDNVYADGNSNNDFTEYTEVFDSEQVGFDGIVSGSETIRAQFSPVTARFIKITFANPGTAVDEVEVFMDKSPKLTKYPTKVPKEGQPGIPSTAMPVNTALPTKTLMPALTDTPVPMDTSTPVPNTPVPTETALPPPPPTDTPVPADTAVPPPTDPPAPPPQPTDTSVPPTDLLLVPLSVPTDTLMPGDGS